MDKIDVNNIWKGYATTIILDDVFKHIRYERRYFDLVDVSIINTSNYMNDTTLIVTLINNHTCTDKDVFYTDKITLICDDINSESLFTVKVLYDSMNDIDIFTFDNDFEDGIYLDSYFTLRDNGTRTATA